MSDAIRWHRFENAEAVARVAVERILAAAPLSIRDHGGFSIVLAGGRTPARVYRLLAESDADWERWQIYFGDERCLPPGHPERNSHMADEIWLGRVGIPRGNVHPIPAELGPQTAAAAYAPLVEAARPFDLVLLGMGEDGHTASLFRGHRWDPEAMAVPVADAPKPPPDRVSLGLAALNDARQLMILVTGAGKAAAVRRWRAGEDLPVARIHGRGGVDVLIDREADGSSQGYWQ